MPGGGPDGTPARARHRVALVASSYAPHVGGVEEHVRQVARELAEAGDAVEVWTVDRGTGPGVREIEGVTVRYLPTPLPSGSVGGVGRFLVALPPAWRAWTSAVRAFRPDLLHVHCFGPNGVYALALHRRFRLPLVVTSHGETVADDTAVFERSTVLRVSLRRALRAAAAVTAPSEFVLERLRADFGLVGGEVVPNGVDLTLQGSGQRTPFEGRYVLGVGRLGRIKGFDLLVETFARAGLDPDLRLVIAGDGPERPALEALIRSEALDDRVLMAGRLDPATVADAMAGSIAVIVPSRVEAFGIVALEAWRSGAALVMTSRGGAAGFVRDGVDGVLVDPLDAEASADALRRVVADGDLRARLASAGRSRVAEYTWHRVAAAYLACYERVLARGRGSNRVPAGPREVGSR
ncbi:glycosyltransferase family 4 protein [Agromyces aurantiacus]|uniref:D-inositol 3-phosphate glycosyltransferase n=1 Tax=Agromyces aurantiacus TaxID=165814 RepID=A0ABV9R1S9_9MICO|nr:glycosyltransferase family 4 protein [Agromyces aurantiacus]MBM7502739.1 glycosyltransferase involved in cell wall biosynthesis [Agromyces aurantiacus]